MADETSSGGTVSYPASSQACYELGVITEKTTMAGESKEVFPSSKRGSKTITTCTSSLSREHVIFQSKSNRITVELEPASRLQELYPFLLRYEGM